jgi:type IV fimbrial biogenesis protein FimT
MYSTRSRSRGQTFFELIITLSISSIALSMACNSWGQIIRKTRATAAINQLLFAVYEARHYALSHRKIVTLCPTQDGQECGGPWHGKLVLFTGSPDKGAEKKIIATYPETPQGSIEWRSFRNDKFLQIQETGQTLAQNGTFIYCPENHDPHYARALILNKQGRARMAQDNNHDGIVELNAKEPATCPH